MKNAHTILKASYFQNSDTIALSRDLLGKFLVSSVDGKITSGIIVETEAYLGAHDKACHAYGKRRTKRTEVMYLPGGHWYVYLCYGIHSLLNVVTHEKDEPHAILIRAIEPVEGIDIMLNRRSMEKVEYRLTSGPGSVSVAMGITTTLTGEPLGKTAWIEDRNFYLPSPKIIASPRVGVDYAQEDALLPYRFQIKDNKWITK